MVIYPPQLAGLYICFNDYLALIITDKAAFIKSMI